MGEIVQQDDKITLFAHFLNQDSSEATVTGTPTITIYHIENATVKTDISAVDMTQVAGSLYFYEFFANANARKTNYVAKYAATVDGVATRTSESFQVVKQNFFDRASSGGPVVNKHINQSPFTDDDKDEILAAIRELRNIKDSQYSMLSEQKLIKHDIINNIDAIRNSVSSLRQVTDSIILELSAVKSDVGKDIKLSSVSTDSRIENIDNRFSHYSEIISRLQQAVSSNASRTELQEIRNGLEEIKDMHQTYQSRNTELENKLSSISSKLDDFENDIEVLSKILIRQSNIDILEEEANEPEQDKKDDSSGDRPKEEDE